MECSSSIGVLHLSAQTLEVGDVGETSAKLKGCIQVDGEVRYRFDWGTAANPEENSTKSWKIGATGEEGKVVEKTIKQLTPDGTPYKYCLTVLVNDGDGDVAFRTNGVYFQTLSGVSPVPEIEDRDIFHRIVKNEILITTGKADRIKRNSARISRSIFTEEPLKAKCWFQWGVCYSAGARKTESKVFTLKKNESADISAKIYGLEENTTYVCNLVAQITFSTKKVVFTAERAAFTTSKSLSETAIVELKTDQPRIASNESTSMNVSGKIVFNVKAVVHVWFEYGCGSNIYGNKTEKEKIESMGSETLYIKDTVPIRKDRNYKVRIAAEEEGSPDKIIYALGKWTHLPLEKVEEVGTASDDGDSGS